ncbi:MAG TPA: hypothetical protein VGK62_06440 [Gaiellaceae bacterium]
MPLSDVVNLSLSAEPINLIGVPDGHEQSSSGGVTYPFNCW